MRIKLLLVCTLLMMSGCIDLFFPELDKYDNLLVVDGKITDAPGPYTVKLNLSSDVSPLEYPPVTDAEVILSDDAGTSELLTEVKPGEYQTSVTGIQGTEGRSYQISIRTSEGREYSSAPELLTAPPPIDSIYPEIEYRQDINYDYELSGLQFYLDGSSPSQDEQYYLFELEATYNYTADYFIEFVYDNGLRPFPEPEKYFTCWKTFTVPEIFTASTTQLTTPTLTRFPLHYVNTENRFLSIRYSLEVNQYSLSQDAYLFWNSIQDQVSQQGTLYTQQPYQIRGNVRNIEDDTEPVLGYFFVAGLAQKRIFVDRPTSLIFNYLPCTLVTEMLAFIFMASGDWPIYVGVNDEGNIGVGDGGCLDCREVGGQTSKPDFWIE